VTPPRLVVPDVSEHQGDIDWKRLVAAHPVVIVRAYNGYRADREFALNRDHAHAAGVRALGLYAYLESDRDVVDQAAEFVHAVGHLRAGEWPIVDCEEGTDSAERVRRWAAYVSRALGYDESWLYSGAWFYSAQHLDKAGIPASRTWLAAYGPREPEAGHALWQYTSHGDVPGVSGPVDCSAFYGTVEQLVAAIRPPAPTQGPTTHPSYPFPAGMHPGGASPSARPLQAALKATGWMDKDIAESDQYGPVTQHAVAGFNRKHGLTSRGVPWDPAIGPRGWALLMSFAYGRS